MFQDSKLETLLREIRYRMSPTIVFVALLLLAGLALMAVYLGKKSEKPREIPQNISFVSKGCREMAAKVDALRADLAKLDPGTGDEMPEAAVDTANALLDARRKWVNGCSAGQERDGFYDDLRARIETTLSSALMHQSRTAELAARSALSDGDFTGALRQASISLRLQKQIDDEHPASRFAQIPREALLERLVQDATYMPIVRKIQSLRSIADGEFLSGDYVAALRDYTSLLQMLREAAPQLPASYMDVDERIRAVTTRQAEVGARLRNREIEAGIAEAESAAARNDWEGAGVAYARVLDLQRSISSDYPMSTLAGARRMDELDARRQNLMCGPLLLRVRQGEARIDENLAGGNDDVLQTALASTNLAISDMSRMFPKAAALQSETFDRVPYLFSIRGDILFLRRAILEHLRTVPGHPGRELLDREVSQLLYFRIMGVNPSARKQDTLPVDNITLDEARAFARRIGWIIGRKTSLPDADIYLAAIGTPSAGFVRSSTWNSTTAPGREVQPVATSKPDPAGFFDLLGNVSEWVEPGVPDAHDALVIGGNVRDNPMRLADVPRDSHEITERIRNNGFRIAVESAAK